ncbi:MAG: HD domain-containing protein [Nitrospirae bacterium]|nr:HD domain-containing protein [Nitrospirota bacterium]
MTHAETYFRDPVHNLVTFSPAEEEDVLFLELIDTPEFQRLRRVKQLGVAELVFQGAEHSRFTHSVGVLHVARRILEQLRKSWSFSRRDRLVVACTALLHDLGHAPFSHVTEAIFGSHHEEWTGRIILDPGTQIHKVLQAYARELPQQVVKCMSYRAVEKFYSQIVSSQLDADRFDYLLRDSLMTGVKYGVFDLERVILGLEVARVSGRNEIVVSEKGFYAVEEYLLSRYHMYRQVYYHKTVSAAGAMLKALFRRAKSLLAKKSAIHAPEGHPFTKLLRGQKMDVSEYTSLDDADMVVFLKEWSRSEDPVLRMLARGLIDRRLFKSIELPGPVSAPKLRKKLRERLRAAYGRDGDGLLLHEQTGDTPYKIYRPGEGESSIYVKKRDGRIAEVSELSPSVKALARKYDIQYLCFPTDIDVSG